MRLVDAIASFLAWRTLERDATRQSLDTYSRVLYRIADDYPSADVLEFEGRRGTELLRMSISRHWGSAKASTRANSISIVHSLFDWLEAEDVLESNPSRRIARPRAKTPIIKRPSEDELEAIREAASTWERPAIVLMEGLGLRNSETCATQWGHIDFLRARILIPSRKGGKPQLLPIPADVLEALRLCHRTIEPLPIWHVVTVRERLFDGTDKQRDTVRDPSRPAGRQAVGRMVRAVCERAGVGPYSPHQLRHGFATRLHRAGVGRDAIQFMLGHARGETTQRYLDELAVETVESELERGMAAAAARNRPSQTSVEESRERQNAEAERFIGEARE